MDQPSLGAGTRLLSSDRSGEVEDRHLEEDDEEDEHVHPVDGQHTVEHHGVQQMHRLPAGEQHQQYPVIPPTRSDTVATTAFALINSVRLTMDPEGRGRADSESAFHRSSFPPSSGAFRVQILRFAFSAARFRRRGRVDHLDAPHHHVVPDAAELVADDAEVTSFRGYDPQAVVVARDDLEVDVERVERESRGSHRPRRGGACTRRPFGA